MLHYLGKIALNKLEFLIKLLIYPKKYAGLQTILNISEERRLIY